MLAQQDFNERFDDLRIRERRDLLETERKLRQEISSLKGQLSDGDDNNARLRSAYAESIVRKS